MIDLRLDYEGPGSYENIREYIGNVLRQNTYPVHDVYTDQEFLIDRLSRAMLYSILHRLGARGDECLGRSNDEMTMEYDAEYRPVTHPDNFICVERAS